MADVRAQFEAAGARDVVTYIQSGNIVFAHARPSAKLVADLEQRLTEVAGFAVPILMRTGAEWSALIRDNPFAKQDTNHLHVLCLPAKPPADALAKIDLSALEPERCALVGRELYLYLPTGIGTSKLAVALQRAKSLAGATARNWRTVLKLRELVDAAG
jgi:uncharacterized protein (DUF1697 family)